MDTWYFMDMNIFTILILLVLLINKNNNDDTKHYQYTLFKMLLIVNIALLFFESLTWYLDGLNGIYYLLNYINVMLYYIFIPFPPIFWLLYVDYLVYEDKKRVKRIILTSSIILIIITTLVILNPIIEKMFYFDVNNYYHRGPLFIVLVLISYLIFIYSFIFILRNKHKIEGSYYLSLLLFTVPPVIGGVFEVKFYGLSIVWNCMAFSLLILFINLHSRKLSTDYLTDLYNRRELDKYIEEKIKTSNASRSFSAIMIDIDNFKQINDLYGHNEGDIVLKAISDSLKRCMRKNDFIARYAGDEFIIILDIQNETELIKVVNKINDFINLYNVNNKKEYELSLSFGYDTYNVSSKMNHDEFINHIDMLMYEEKKSKKISENFEDEHEDIDINN